MRPVVTAWLTLCAMLCAPMAGATEPWPRVIVAYPVGGPADLVARQVAAALQRQTGSAPLIENVPGAGGGLGVARLLASTAASPGWMVGTPSETIVAPLLNPVLGYRPEMLRLVGIASTVPVALVASLQGPARPLGAMLAGSRDGTQPLICGNYGVGSHAHLAGVELAARTRTPLLHVPHAGVAPLLRELVGGRIDIAFLPLNRSVLDLVDQGRLRLLGLAAERRDGRLPDLPTVDEAAGVSGIAHRLWVGLFIPASAGDAGRAAAGAALAAALDDPAYRAQKLAEGVLPGEPMTQAEADRLYAAEITQLRRWVAALPP
jgi:tripartite-type tricarboxylate transporter receptor subunit TctC